MPLNLSPTGPSHATSFPPPAALCLQVSMYSMQRSERYWRDPLAFRPERWLAGSPEAEEVRRGPRAGEAGCMLENAAVRAASLPSDWLRQRAPCPSPLPAARCSLPTLQVVPGAYVPFGAGSRQCVGAKFAQVEACLTLIQLYKQARHGQGVEADANPLRIKGHWRPLQRPPTPPSLPMPPPAPPAVHFSPAARPGAAQDKDADHAGPRGGRARYGAPPRLRHGAGRCV